MEIKELNNLKVGDWVYKPSHDKHKHFELLEVVSIMSYNIEGNMSYDILKNQQVGQHTVHKFVLNDYHQCSVPTGRLFMVRRPEHQITGTDFKYGEQYFEYSDNKMLKNCYLTEEEAEKALFWSKIAG